MRRTYRQLLLKPRTSAEVRDRDFELRESTVPARADCPETLRRLFQGRNPGKQLLKVTDPEIAA